MANHFKPTRFVTADKAGALRDWVLFVLGFVSLLGCQTNKTRPYRILEHDGHGGSELLVVGKTTCRPHSYLGFHTTSWADAECFGTICQPSCPNCFLDSATHDPGYELSTVEPFSTVEPERMGQEPTPIIVNASLSDRDLDVGVTPMDVSNETY